MVIFLDVVTFAMLIRAVLSWIPMDPNKFTDFIHAITEPVILPLRALFYKLNWFQGMPIDMSFLITCLLLSMLTMFLS